MKIIQHLSTLLLILASQCSFAKGTTEQLQLLVDNHLKKYAEQEHISNITLSVLSPEFKNIKTVYSGTVEFAGKSPVGEHHLYQIGSITKSFIAAILLQLEADPRYHFNINDPLIKYLPQYPKWGNVTIKQLLNMTSYIPSYTEDETFAVVLSKNFTKEFSPEELVGFVYDKPMQTFKNKYYYSNTNYILAGMVIAKLTGHSVEEEMNLRLLGTDNLTHLNLPNTFYVTHLYSEQISNRLVNGYAYKFQNAFVPPKTDITRYSLSWAGAAGANVSNTVDIIRWAQALYTMNQVLPAKQLAELTSTVSVKTGLPIQQFSAEDSDGFGLGVGVSYDPEHPQDLIYNYEGGTLGYRAFYISIPTQHIIIAVAVNSMVNEDNDHLSELLGQVYELLSGEQASANVSKQ